MDCHDLLMIPARDGEHQSERADGWDGARHRKRLANPMRLRNARYHKEKVEPKLLGLGDKDLTG